MTKMLCPGPFDLITNDYPGIITRARDLFGEALVAVGCNSLKAGYLFGEQRVGLVREATTHLDGAAVEKMDGLLVNFAREHGITAVAKGLEFSADFSFEFQLANIDHSLAGLETVLLPTVAQHVALSSTITQEVIKLGNDVSPHVPSRVAEVAARLRDTWQPHPALVFEGSGDSDGSHHRTTGTLTPDCG